MISLDHIRKLRNPLVHFHPPGDVDSLEYQSILENEMTYEKLENDARAVIEIVIRVLEKLSEIV